MDLQKILYVILLLSMIMNVILYVKRCSNTEIIYLRKKINELTQSPP